MKPLYTTTVTVVGGREGQAKSKDEHLNLKLVPPKEMGGPANGNGTNPEQLFAAGYSACFESAVRHVARLKKITITRSSVTGDVTLGSREDGAFTIAVKLAVSLPDLDRNTAEMLVQEAHRVCPYSNATRGNIDVQLSVMAN